MRVALVHERVGGKAGGGGGVRQMLELALGLRREGHDVVIACHDFEQGTEFASTSDLVEVRSVRRGATGREASRGQTASLVLRGMRSVARLIPSDVDVINAHEWPAQRAGAAASARIGAPLVWTRNDETLFERAVIPSETTLRPSGAMRAAHGAFGALDFLDARRASTIVVLDERNARMARRAYRRPVEIVRSGPARQFFEPPDPDAARDRLGVPRDAFFVLGFGILFPHRRHEDLIAATGLLSDLDGLQVRIVGSPHAAPAHADALGAAIVDGGLQGVASLEPRALSEAELRDHYAAADAFVFPNERQTWGLAPLEALAGGTPVVLSSGAGVHDVLHGRPGVWTVAPRSPEAIAAAIRDIRSSGAGGLEQTRGWIGAELTAERYAQRMAEIYARSR